VIASEGGAVVTDAAGEPFDDRPLLGSAAEFQMSVAIACNPALHEQIVSEVGKGLELLRNAHGEAKPARSP
jgi:hypothetical protein